MSARRILGKSLPVMDEQRNTADSLLTVKLAEGHVKLVNVQSAVTVGVIVADHMAQIASRA